MSRAWILLLLCCPLLTGCAMCGGEDDYNYSAYGGSLPRFDMAHGRVGSAFGFVSETTVMPTEAEPYLAPPSPIDVLPTPAATIGDQ